MIKLENQHEGSTKIIRTAAQTAILMSLLTLGSKGFGFIREMVMANYFGTSYVVDAYVMAQSIPNILFAGIFAAIGTAYIPLFSHKMEKESSNAGNAFTGQIIIILFFVSTLSAIIGIIFSEQLTTIFAKGFTGETSKLTSFFLKVTFSYVIFSSVSGIFEAFLQYKNVFIPPILMGYVQNLIIIGTIVISAVFNYYYLCFGVLFAYIVRLVFMWILSKKNGFEQTKNIDKTKDLIKEMAKLSLPVFLGTSSTQINLFVDKYLASSLPEGSVAALNYANILNTMIMSLSVTVLTAMIYPRLAKASATGEQDRFNELVQKGFNLITIIAVPFSLGAMLYHEEVVQVIFERGLFDVVATKLTGSAYLYYSVGMVFMGFNTLLTQVYYSRHKMKEPMIIAGISVIINILLSLAFVGSMQHNGLALATSIAALASCTLLYLRLRQVNREIQVIENKRKLLITIICGAVSVAVSYGVYVFMKENIWMPRLIYLFLSTGVAAGLYLRLLVLFKIEEVNILKSLIGR